MLTRKRLHVLGQSDPEAAMKPESQEAILEECRRSLAEVGLESKADKKTAELSYGEKRMLE